MGGCSPEARGLAKGAAGSARVIAFGASNVAPAGAVVGGLVIVVAYAGFASPLVVLVAFAASRWAATGTTRYTRLIRGADIGRRMARTMQIWMFGTPMSEQMQRAGCDVLVATDQDIARSVKVEGWAARIRRCRPHGPAG